MGPRTTMTGLESKIKLFLDHFKEKLDRLESYSFEQEDRLFKKNIIVSILDALARTTSNENSTNRDRFTGIVANFGDWPNHTRVSTSHLSYFLARLREPSFEPARRFVFERISSHSDGRLVDLVDDPELDEVAILWPVSAEQKLLGDLRLTSFTHLNLFYLYRNSLIHELREPGYGMEFSDSDTEPFYHGMTTDNDQQTLELVYPLNFYFRIVRNVLKNLHPYLATNRIDPYECYKFGSSWVGELNA